jgi:hypothetical protein
MKTMYYMNIIRALSYGASGNARGLLSLFDKTTYVNTDDLLEVDETNPDYVLYDRYVEPTMEPALGSEHDDINYNYDAGNEVRKAFSLYVGEPVDRATGRGRNGSLDPSGGDDEDWYAFTVCSGQTITASVTTSENYSFNLANVDGDPVGVSYVADESGRYFLCIYAEEGAEAGDYILDVTLTDQNDSGTGDDAGDAIGEATAITPGSYYGYMDVDDQEDWYSFNANNGDGIFVTVDTNDLSDFDIHLYNPAGEEVHNALWYGEDELEYPADASGTWKIKLDMFPGWDESKWPENYFLYGSGLYELELTVGGTAEAPVTPVPQPEINPIAQTFIVNNDPESNQDEYVYLAAVPAANYMENDQRYVSPIVYTGETMQTNWFGTVDNTTQYLVDDWNTYLARHGMTATEHILPDDPVAAAAYVAAERWSPSNKAVVVVDGSAYEDDIRTIVDRNAKLNAVTEEISVPPDSEDFVEVGSLKMYPMLIGPKWGALAVYGLGDNYGGDIGLTTPRYEAVMDDWWPSPYDINGPDTDVYYPITLPGFWFPYTTGTQGMDEMKIIKVDGDRYKVPIRDTDSSIKVTVTTDEPTYLRIYLVDPYGNVRRPRVPHWNGGPVNPIHIWNGGHWPGIGYDEWRFWQPTLSTEHTEEVHYPMKGRWTAIVVPAMVDAADETYDYHVTVEVRQHSPKRTAAALSAANGVVIASQEHIPLLYVKEDSIPTETENALNTLGTSEIIFVELDNIGSEVRDELDSYTLTDLTTMQDIIDTIGENPENLITITSLATGEGYFAPSGMIAAYHCSPVLSIGEAADAYNKVDMINAWREYAGDFYHGCRSVGHLPQMSKPFNFTEFIEGIKNEVWPTPGFDLKKRWFTEVYEGIHALIDGYGLDREGQEAYLFVSPRDKDIRGVVGRAMMGNNSYAGHIPVETPAFSSAIIVRDILYPAVIYANPGRNVTTSQLMNYADGGPWKTNDGENIPSYTTRDVKESFSSRGRFFEGHCVWEGLLERYNTGASISYYTGHGTGGSGISAQFKNVAEDFEWAELTHEHLKNFQWWDGWRGYTYDNRITKTPRNSGSVRYNAEEPNLYDIIHFKWCDALFENLHSEMDFWSSCTTGEHFGPTIYLEHGAALWYGNSGSAYGIQTSLHDNMMFHDMMVEGKNIGESHSKYLWRFDRDFTTGDPRAMYGSSTNFQGGLPNVQVIYGDPTMTCFTPEWVEPVPINP